LGGPLDKDAAYLYGQFVQAAYAMFENKQNPDPLCPGPIDIPDGYELSAWIQMSDFVLGDKELKFYGIVAHSLAHPDSRIIAIRGTEGAVEWWDDVVAVPIPFRQVPAAGKVATGFDKIYSTMQVVKCRKINTHGSAPVSFTDIFTGSFAEQLEQLAISREAERGIAPPAQSGLPRQHRPTIVTGHSLGSALAALFVMENNAKRKFDISTLCTFASPRVGNTEFVHLFNQLPINSWRLLNTRDIVPKLPPHIPIVLDYQQVNDEYSFDAAAFAKKSLTCSHSMDTYLHWLNASHALQPSCDK